MEQVVDEVFRKYNITPHSTLKYKSPNQVHYNIPSSSRQYLYSSVDEVTKEVSEEAQKGHEKFLKVLQKRSDQLYSKAKLPKVGQYVMVLAPKCAQNRLRVMKNYLGLATVERPAEKEHMFFVRWLHNGKSKKVKKNMLSNRPYPSRYFVLI